MKKKEIKSAITKIFFSNSFSCNHINEIGQFFREGNIERTLNEFYKLIATELSGQEEGSGKELLRMLEASFEGGAMLGYFGDDHTDMCKEQFGYSCFIEWYKLRKKDFASQFQQEDKISDERFKMPMDKQLIEIMILFNKRKLQKNKLADMLSPCLLILDRLYENGDVTIPTKKENKD